MTRKTSPTAKLALIAVVAAWVVFEGGWIVRQRQLARQEEQLRAIIARLALQNADFAHLRPSRSSHPNVWIFGQLQPRAEIDQLREAVAAEFGAVEADRIVRVSVMLEVFPTSQPGGK